MAQRLINEDELLDVGEHTLDECHIREYSTLTVINILDTPTSSTPINITIKAFQGYKKELDVLSNDTVLSVKDKIQVCKMICIVVYKIRYNLLDYLLDIGWGGRGWGDLRPSSEHLLSRI